MGIPFLFSQGVEGYYRYPDVHGNRVVFVAEGDLWTVSLSGGVAQRITSHPEEELYPSFSPDGKSIAFSAQYEGPMEVYTMPVDGGVPTRWTYEADASVVEEWTPQGELVYGTLAYSKVPDLVAVKIDPQARTKEPIPLGQASEVTFSDDGKTMYFVRPAFHRNVTKRYIGGTARQIWKYTEGTEEAAKLTTDYAGESHHPMYYKGRVYFLTDRDGVMNLWSMDESGQDRMQHTRHTLYDARFPNLHEGTLVYQHGADIRHFDINTGEDRKIPISLISDFDQLRPRWDENPSRYITSVSPSHDGARVVVTARGRVFAVPVKQGRVVSFTEPGDVRYRDALFSKDGKMVVTLSDQSGEFEWVEFPSDGTGEIRPITSDGNLLRFGGQLSPDGTKLAYRDLDGALYYLELKSGKNIRVSNPVHSDGLWDFSWSPDSRWISYSDMARNTMAQIHLYQLETGERVELTTDRANSWSPRWDPKGDFIYFLSDRNFQSLVGSPWGTRAPDPYFTSKVKLYHIPLKKGTRSPFREQDELYKSSEKAEPKPAKKDKKKEADETEVKVEMDREGLQSRLAEVPISAGNYDYLAVTDKAIYVMARDLDVSNKRHIKVLEKKNEDVELKDFVADAQSFQLTGDGKQLLVSKSGAYYMIKAGTSKVSDLNKSKIDFSGWRFELNPREDWRQIFRDAWRMERDYFYDPNMHGVNWDAMYDKYLPFVDRVTTREELSDLIGEMVGELSVLHTSVRGGDTRDDGTSISVATLGGIFKRDAEAKGYRIEHIYKGDPDYAEQRSPLDQPHLDIQFEEVITHVNGRSVLEANDLGELLRNQVGKQVRLALSGPSGKRDVIVKPVGSSYNYRYYDWEYGNRLKVEEMSENKIGYIHLRAMGSNDVSQFYREFFPVFDRQGLIIDVRFNFGGNIDSFILSKLIRKAWMYWQQRTGVPIWNMQYAFRGHMAILVNENTYSDGEAFADGFTRLDLGKSFGMRTWGGEVWLSSSNRLTDNGLARAPMMGVYGANGKWLIEGHGYEPDEELDNLPHATYMGEDAQLNRAVDYLLEEIRKDPRKVPPHPPYPDKSFTTNKKQ